MRLSMTQMFHFNALNGLSLNYLPQLFLSPYFSPAIFSPAFDLFQDSTYPLPGNSKSFAFNLFQDHFLRELFIPSVLCSNNLFPSSDAPFRALVSYNYRPLIRTQNTRFSILKSASDICIKLQHRGPRYLSNSQSTLHASAPLLEKRHLRHLSRSSPLSSTFIIPLSPIC